MMLTNLLRALGPLAFVVALGCSARVRDQAAPAPVKPTAAPGPTVAPGPTAELVALRARADRSLAASWPLDYDRPLKAHEADRPATAALYAEACRGGDKQACWIAATLGGWSPAISAAVHDNCVAGDLLSCRALPRDRSDAVAPAFPEAPGRAGRSVACGRAAEQPGAPACDLGALRSECTLGFPHSCELASARADPASRDHDALDARQRELARDGCRARIGRECGEQLVGGNAAEEREIDERMCPLERDWCGNLSLLAQDAGDLVRARDLAERVCQYGAADSANSCVALAGRYLGGELPEPAPRRGEALLTWACSQPRMTELRRECAPRTKPAAPRSRPR